MKAKRLELEVGDAKESGDCAAVVAAWSDRQDKKPSTTISVIYLIRRDGDWMLLPGTLPFSNDSKRFQTSDQNEATYAELRGWFDERKVETMRKQGVGR